MRTGRGSGLIIAFIGVLAAAALPASADTILSFGFTGVRASFDDQTSVFTTSILPTTTVGSVTRDLDPIGSATFVNDPIPNGWSDAGGDFSITMTLFNITATEADAMGVFAIEDVLGNLITGDITGVWTRQPLASTFVGALSNVTYTGDGTFEGHYGQIAVPLAVPQPWVGTLIELSSTETWFTEGSYTAVPASVDASIVPEPASAFLIMLGIGLIIQPLRRRRR